MAFLDKLNDFAYRAGEAVNDAIDTGKLTAKIHSEQSGRNTLLRTLGEMYYNAYKAGVPMDKGAEKLCSDIDLQNAKISALQAELNACKAGSRSNQTCGTGANSGVCPRCGAHLSADCHFCPECGVKL